MSKIIFGNSINQFTTAVPELVDTLISLAPRKLWYAHDGDMVVAPRPISEYFKQYACSITEATAEHIEVLYPGGSPGAYLAARVLDNANAYETLLGFARNRLNAIADVYMQDQITTDFFVAAGIPIYPYRKFPSQSVLNVVSRINTKSGFRDIAASLNIKTVPGTTVQGVSKAQEAARALLQKYGPLIIKIDRGSNGNGHLIINDEADLDDIPTLLDKFSEPADRYTIEKMMTFVSLPSIEFEILESGPEKTYDCSMRCVNNTWTGMITPAHDLPNSIQHVMNQWGVRLAEFLYQHGFRGTVDVDCGVTGDGTIYANESNCRHTGGSYVHFLLSRLKGADYLRSTTWLADSRVSMTDQTFEDGVEAIQASGLAWNATRGEGVILTNDSRDINKKWHYLVVAKTPAHALDTEKQLLAMLGA